MADYPCKNPHCKSFGSSHPNCRCGPQGVNGYAKGGLIPSYCSREMPHDNDCTLFADGGDVQDFDSITPDPNQPEDAESRATTGFGQIFKSAPVQNALDVSGNLDRYGNMVKSAMSGDEGAQHQLAQQSLGTAMGALGAESQAARLARAEKMGFDTSKTYYHGTAADFDRFKTTGAPNGAMLGEGTYVTADPEYANKFAAQNPNSSFEDPIGGRVLPVHVRVQNPFDLSAPASKKIIKVLKNEPGIDPDLTTHLHKSGKDNGDVLAAMGGSRIPFWRQTQILQDAGHDAVKDGDILNIFDPKNIRSKFAEFDPKQAKSSKLSYADGGSVEGQSFDSIQEAAPDFDSIQEAPKAGPTAQNEVAPDFDSIQTAEDKYGTTGQQVLTGVEGAARGLAGPLATGAELGLSALGVPGLSAEDQAGREAANPIIHGASEAGALAGSMMMGVGEARLAAKAASAAAEAAGLGKIGSAVMKGAIESGMFQGGDEMSKAMLGQGDPSEPVSAAIAHMGAAGLLGAASGGLFSAVGSGADTGLKALENTKLGSKAESFLRGLGANSLGIAAKDLEIPPSSIESFKAGQKLHQHILDNSAEAGSSAMAKGAAASMTGGILGYEALQKILQPILKPIVQKGISVTNKYVPAAMAKAIGMGETTGLFNILDHATQVSKGVQKINKGIDSLFKAGSQQGVEAYSSDADRERLRKIIENGGVTQQIKNEMQAAPQEDNTQNFAEGGNVQPAGSQTTNHLAQVYPEQNMMLNTAKGRVYNYLNSIRPQPTSTLPLDSQHKDLSKEREYNKALDIGNNPLSVLNHIQSGTVSINHVKHLNGMYPELYKNLSDKLHQRIAESVLNKNKPSYRARLGMSTFLGQPLDSTMTPQAMMAAQQANMGGSQPQQQAAGGPQTPNGGKHNTSGLSKLAQNAQTPGQAAESRRANKD